MPTDYLKTANSLSEVVLTYQHAKPTAEAILVETKKITDSLTQIQDTLLENPEQYSEWFATTPELKSIYDIAL
jgi:hypothetical protein